MDDYEHPEGWFNPATDRWEAKKPTLPAFAETSSGGPSPDADWWDDRTMPNDSGPDWRRDADGTLWQIDPRTGRRARFEETR